MNIEQNKKEKLAKPRYSSENWRTEKYCGLYSDQKPGMLVALLFNARDRDQVPNGVQYILFLHHLGD